MLELLKNMPEKSKKKFYKNKYFIILLVLALVVLFAISSGGKKDVLPFEYIEVEQRDLEQVVSVTGKVEPAESVDLSFNLSGHISGISVKVGDMVGKGKALSWLDTKDAETSVASAQINLENAILDLEKLRRQKEEGPSSVSKKKAEDELEKLYKESFNLLSEIYSEVPTDIKNLEDYYETDENQNENQGHIDYYADLIANFEPIYYDENEFEKSYKNIRSQMETSFLSYQKININSSYEKIDTVLNETYDSINEASKLIRETRDITELYLQTLTDKGLTPSQISRSTTETELTTISTLSSELEDHLISLLDYRQDINNQIESIIDVDIDIESQELVVKNEENDLQSAKNNLSDHYIFAPFDGIVTDIDGKVGEVTSSNRTVLSLISNNSLEVEVNVPEVDIAKIEEGDSAHIILDAYGQDLIFEAEVISINPAATIIDGVATYKVTLTFKENYPQIRPGMTADIDILTAEEMKVLAVPSRSVIRRNGDQYVEVFVSEDDIREVSVVTGIRGSDGFVEIKDGLKIGDKVITYRQE